MITPTFNAGCTLPQLYRSLQAQTFRNFEWLVSDALSLDGSAQLLAAYSAESSWCKPIVERDFGIYDAINKAILRCEGTYYLVAGADDVMDENALENYAKYSVQGSDVVLAKVIRGHQVLGGFAPSLGWVGPSKAFRGSHSVGMLFRKDLHEKFGMYSSRFPMLADGYFLKKLLRSRSVRFVEADFVAGTFADTGLSSVSKLQTLAETWQIQMLTEDHALLQTAIFMGKIAIRATALLKEMSRNRERTGKQL